MCVLWDCCKADLGLLIAAVVSPQDGTMGLVKLVLAGRTKRAIQRLTQTFLTLSLTDIAQQVGLQDAAEAEGHILRYLITFYHSIVSFGNP